MSSTGVEKMTPTGHLTATTPAGAQQPRVSIEPVGATEDVSEKDRITTVKEVGATHSSSILNSESEGKSEDEVEGMDLDSEEYAGIPELVRNIVSFEDDPTLPVITFRSVLLSVVFCVIGSFVSQLS